MQAPYIPRSRMAKLDNQQDGFRLIMAELGLLIIVVWFLSATIIPEKAGVEITLPAWHDGPFEDTMYVAAKHITKISLEAQGQILYNGTPIAMDSLYARLTSDMWRQVQLFPPDSEFSPNIILLDINRSAPYWSYIWCLGVVKAAYCNRDEHLSVLHFNSRLSHLTDEQRMALTRQFPRVISERVQGPYLYDTYWQ